MVLYAANVYVHLGMCTYTCLGLFFVLHHLFSLLSPGSFVLLDHGHHEMRDILCFYAVSFSFVYMTSCPSVNMYGVVFLQVMDPFLFSIFASDFPLHCVFLFIDFITKDCRYRRSGPFSRFVRSFVLLRVLLIAGLSF